MIISGMAFSSANWWDNQLLPLVQKHTHSLPGLIYSPSMKSQRWRRKPNYAFSTQCFHVARTNVIPLVSRYLLHLSQHTWLKHPALPEVNLVVSCVEWNLWPLAELVSGPSMGSLIARFTSERYILLPKLWSRGIAKQLELTKNRVHKMQQTT